MKRLEREDILRMFNGGTGGSSGSGGGLDPSALAGYATQAWVEGGFVSKAFFNELFEVTMKTVVTEVDPSTTPATVISTTTTTSVILPNEVIPQNTSVTDPETGYVTSTVYTLDNIQVKAGFWTNSYLSALGQNAGGGGGGGTTLFALLDSINTSAIGNTRPDADPSNIGKCLVWTENGWGWGTTGSSYTLPPATTSTLGGIKVGNGLSVVSDGTLSLATSGIAAGTYTKVTVDTYGRVTSGSSPTTLSGYGITNAYTKTEADGKFMTIAAFERLFNALDSSNNKLTHPYASGLASIKAMVGLWTNQYLSALGQNSGGGGGGSTLFALLDSINTSAIGNTRPDADPSNVGKCLVWTENGWGWGTTGSSYTLPPATTSTLGGIKAGNGLSVVSDGTLSLATSGVTAGTYTKVTVDTYGRVTSGSSPTTLSGYGITDAVSSSMTWWGRSISNGTVTGSMSGVGSIEMSSILYMANGQSIYFKDTGGTYRNVMTFNASNILAIGYHVRQQGYTTDIQGGTITFGVGASRVEAMDISSAGLVRIIQGTQGLQIGDARLIWDSENNALKVTRYSGGSEVACNLYATGGVSSLGLSGSGGATISNMVITDTLYFNNNENGGTIDTMTGDLMIGTHGNSGWVKIDDMCSSLGDNYWKIQTSGYAQFKRLYLDNSRYIYIDADDGNKLKYYDGSTSRTIQYS